jgi:hypothetical protein
MRKLDVAEDTCYVYCFYDPAKGEILYIGRSDACGYKIREKNHLTTSKKSHNYKVRLGSIT